jgi:hypothetical protein
MNKAILAALALVAASPAAAGQTGESSSAQSPAPDAATTQAAERFVSLILPSGTIQRMFGAGGIGMESMLEMRVGDFGPIEGVTDALDPNLTMAQVMEARDPHFRERMRITSEVTNRIFGEVFTAIEPEFRTAMVEMYARRFTRAELEEMNVFFAAGPGQKFAQIAFTMMQDPAFLRMMRTMMPRIAEATPRIGREVAAATAHLPPPPPDADEDDEEDEEDEDSSGSDRRQE